MIFKSVFLHQTLNTSFEIVFKKNPTLLIVIIFKYIKESIYGYNFLNNTVKEKLFFYSKDFLRTEQNPRNSIEYPIDSKNTLKIPKISYRFFGDPKDSQHTLHILNIP